VLGKRIHEAAKENTHTVHFKWFHQIRRDKVYKDLNEAEKLRFEAHNEAFG